MSLKKLFIIIYLIYLPNTQANTYINIDGKIIFENSFLLKPTQPVYLGMDRKS